MKEKLLGYAFLTCIALAGANLGYAICDHINKKRWWKGYRNSVDLKKKYLETLEKELDEREKALKTTEK